MGPLVGGFLTDALSWRWVLFLNVPITLIAMFITARYVPESRGEISERSIDYRGIATLSGAVVAILAALDQGTQTGFGDPAILILFAVGIGLLVVFAFVERREGPTALIPPEVLGNRQFVAACAAVLTVSAIFFSAILFLPQFMEKQLGYSPLDAGVGLLPMMLLFAGTSFVAGGLYNRLGAKTVVMSGAACLGIGMLALSFLDDGSGYAILVPGMIIVGIGIGLFYSSITTAGITALDPGLSSLAGGIIYMCQIAGGSIGLGLNTAIVLSASSFTEGIAIAFRVDAALAGVGFLIAFAFIGGEEPVTDRIHLRHHSAHG
jgi:MFS family permease